MPPNRQKKSHEPYNQTTPLFLLKHAFSIPIAHVPRGKQRYRSRHYYHYVRCVATETSQLVV